MDAARVLVIDDDLSLVQLICRSLERRGVTAKAAATVAEARTAAQPSTRIVVDLSAVSQATSDDLEWLRQRRPIVLTGASPAHGHEIADKIEASAYLEKPVEIGELIEALG